VDEFELIKKYFHNQENKNFSCEKNIVLGIGDDAAVFEIDKEYQLVSTIDTLVENIHFPENCKAEDIGFKALAVNLSDLAAMGASPHSFLLSITLPSINEAWLEKFSKGLFELANQHKVVLLGGDTSKGPLSISIQINGLVKKNKFLKRSSAQAGDVICATGYLGLAALGLKEWRLQKWQAGNNLQTSEALARFLRPEPRIILAQKFYGLGVRACIDISDGLLSEVKHLCKSSSLSAQLDFTSLLIHSELIALEKSKQLALMLTGGDDYELCFSIAKDKLAAVKAFCLQENIPLNVFGEFIHDDFCELKDMKGKFLDTSKSGYTHF